MLTINVISVFFSDDNFCPLFPKSNVFYQYSLMTKPPWPWCVMFLYCCVQLIHVLFRMLSSVSVVHNLFGTRDGFYGR